ncbi:hypothetical protein DAPPUDRAFT_251148 [Daphnia pulex]|uniref:DUF659 domain-containing protein n=1 Tax=Daphnia pulex TaxID=6669 RepID=E9GZU0_DAPPU|nr:hypothetical protein DAPPUDRAFT_251148 [Daphnia pulex]|eukprot:EFX74992.1 hypothetical protein DAPPUDRAFT_251148 [Daphnia pulex]
MESLKHQSAAKVASELKDVVIWVAEIDGKRSDENLAGYLMEIINAYGIGDKLFCITADNISSNRTLARALQNALLQLNAAEQKLCCIGHGMETLATFFTGYRWGRHLLPRQWLPI